MSFTIKGHTDTKTAAEVRAAAAKFAKEIEATSANISDASGSADLLATPEKDPA